MKVLVVTNMYPSSERPAFGIFVKEQVESLREAGLGVDVFAFDGSDGMVSYLRAARALRRRLREARHSPYDLVHAHYGLSGVVARMQGDCPVIMTFHGSDLMGGVGPDYAYTLSGAAQVMISNLLAPMVNRCIVVADIQKRRLILSSAVTIPMGVDLRLFTPQPREVASTRVGLDPNKRWVLFVAHPRSYTKRFDIAEAAVQILQEDDPNIQLLAVYDVPHDQIPSYMNAADVLVLTSMHEGSPCVIKEALACNLPIVSVDVGDVSERINGVSGCYLCERTPEDVATKLRAALAGERLTSGREKVLEFGLENVAQALIAVYRDVLERK